MVYSFNPNTGGRDKKIFEFEASLVYVVYARTDKAT